MVSLKMNTVRGRRARPTDVKVKTTRGRPKSGSAGPEDKGQRESSCGVKARSVTRGEMIKDEV